MQAKRKVQLSRNKNRLTFVYRTELYGLSVPGSGRVGNRTLSKLKEITIKKWSVLEKDQKTMAQRAGIVKEIETGEENYIQFKGDASGLCCVGLAW